ncbi:MAG: glycosyltransferase [Acidobacteria bacterium]|nr:glycosyltransferase [Acidobacteriota bacterium]
MKLLIAATIEGTLRSFLLPFARHFRELGWRVDCMAQGASSCAECQGEFDHTWEAAWSRSPWNPDNLKIAIGQVRSLVGSEEYDLVHVHTPVAAFVTRLALRGLRRRGLVKVVYTAHGFHFHRAGSPVKNLVFRLLEWGAGQWTDYLVVINREDEDAAKAYRLLPAERVVYMPGIGVDTGLLDPDRVAEERIQALRDGLGLSDGDKLISMLAWFEPRKRHQDAIRAIAALRRSDVHLALAGDGKLLDPMKRLASDMGIARQVHFLGAVSDVAPLIRASAATLLPSSREGLARSVMESLSLAVPVIGTNARGVGELLSGGGGLVVGVGDVPALSRAIQRLLDHPAEARAMGRAGRARMQSYDIRHILKLHEDLYGRAVPSELSRENSLWDKGQQHPKVLSARAGGSA